MADRFDDVISELRSDRAEMRREFSAWSAHINRLQEQTDENIRFLRELNRRGELALQELVRSQSAMRAEIRASTAETRASTAQIRANTESVKANTEIAKANTETAKASTETVKAHTRAILAVIDRLEGGGGVAPAT